MKYTLYVASVFTITFGAVAVVLATGRRNYRKAFGK